LSEKVAKWQNTDKKSQESRQIFKILTNYSYFCQDSGKKGLKLRKTLSFLRIFHFY